MQRNATPSECRFNVTGPALSASQSAATSKLMQLQTHASGQSEPTSASKDEQPSSQAAAQQQQSSKSGIYSGLIKNSDVPEQLQNYTKQNNVSLECIWNITVMPGWKVCVD